MAGASPSESRRNPHLDRKRDINSIVITTAGKVGVEAARLLSAQGQPARVLVRDPEKFPALLQAGVEVAEGDLEVPATIDAAMRGENAELEGVTPCLICAASRAGRQRSVLDRLPWERNGSSDRSGARGDE
jgi:nucleoside-diphosphate-sugar epimerase